MASALAPPWTSKISGPSPSRVTKTASTDAERRPAFPLWGREAAARSTPTRPLLRASSRRGVPPRRRSRSSAGPARPAARPKPPLSIGSTLPSPLLFPRQFPLLAQSYLKEHQEHNCAKSEGDQRDGEHFAGQPTDQGGADRTSDNQRRGRSECQDARAGRHRPKVSLRVAAERTTVAGNESAASRDKHDARPAERANWLGAFGCSSSASSRGSQLSAPAGNT